MAYEYEEIIVKQHLSNFRSKTGKLIDTKESLELREVYAKAKAFNEIEKHLKEIHNDFKGNINEIHRLLGQETEFIIEDMEDK